jgi:hypothetical protein
MLLIPEGMTRVFVACGIDVMVSAIFYWPQGGVDDHTGVISVASVH